jgi:hypothetical protein
MTATDVELFMAANLFLCELLCARITARQCELNRTMDTFLCRKCTQDQPENEEAARLARRVKRHKKDNPESPWREQLYNRSALGEVEAQRRQAQVKAAQSVVEPAEGRGQRAEGRGQRGRRPPLPMPPRC